MRGIYSVCLCCICLLSSCGLQEIYLHDHHSLSYPVCAQYAVEHPGTTLVLLDYHHDIGYSTGSVKSFNWVSRLVEDGLLSRVIWVSGRKLKLPNRESRIAWLERSLVSFSPSTADMIRKCVVLADWFDLKKMSFSEPLIVSLDLDILCHDPGESADAFLDELVSWIENQRPPLLTLAFSAAYQNRPDEAWAWLARFLNNYKVSTANWYLQAGIWGRVAEGQEEAVAWRNWRKHPEVFQQSDTPFWPGLGVWLQAPADIRSRLLSLKIKSGDSSAATIISAWSDPARQALESEYDHGRLRSFASISASALDSLWKGERVMEPEPTAHNSGVAVRLLRQGVDRGCLALYRGVSDYESSAAYCVQMAARDPRYSAVQNSEAEILQIEVSVFGAWEDINSPLDFIPGLDSLLVSFEGESTLLQASLAVERGLDAEGFLRILARKAGLGENGWTNPGLHFKRAPTVWYKEMYSSLNPKTK